MASAEGQCAAIGLPSVAAVMAEGLFYTGVAALWLMIVQWDLLDRLLGGPGTACTDSSWHRTDGGCHGPCEAAFQALIVIFNHSKHRLSWHSRHSYRSQALSGGLQDGVKCTSLLVAATVPSCTDLNP